MCFISIYSVLNTFRIYMFLRIKKHYFIHFCCLFLKSSKAFSVSLSQIHTRLFWMANILEYQAESSPYLRTLGYRVLEISFWKIKCYLYVPDITLFCPGFKPKFAVHNSPSLQLGLLWTQDYSKSLLLLSPTN